MKHALKMKRSLITAVLTPSNFKKYKMRLKTHLILSKLYRHNYLDLRRIFLK